jgi:hypothetical protein
VALASEFLSSLLKFFVLCGYAAYFLALTECLLQKEVEETEQPANDVVPAVKKVRKKVPTKTEKNKKTKIKNKSQIVNQNAPNGKSSDFITRYCYSEEERLKAIQELGPDPEITRFKGLGEISPEEFAGFIGPDMRLEQVTLHKTDQVQKLLEYYMGKNTMERQNFIIDNLVIEEDRPEEDIYE